MLPPGTGRRLVDIAEVGLVALLFSGAASGMAGDTIRVDRRLYIMA